MRIEESYFEPEVRDGFYVPSEVKQAWAAEMKVLEEIDRICKKYEIPYFADWGTLLGVVRHGGFIPWDDDLDITMKRPDYERFLEVARKEMPEGYSVFTYATHPEFWSFMGRFVAKNRICFEAEHMKEYYGFPYIVGIDIFVLDYVFENTEMNEERNHRAKYIIEVADAIAEKRMVGNDAKMVLDYIEREYQVKLGNRKDLHALRVRMYKEAEKLFGMFSEAESKELTRMMPNELYSEHKFRLKKEYYDKQIWLPFEGISMPVPLGYDEMLRRRYGDYMRLVRNCGGHDYPFFGTQKKQLQAVLDFEMPGYKYAGIADRDVEAGRAGSLKGMLKEAYAHLEHSLDILVEQNFVDIESLQECQQLAIDMGTLIEQCKGEGHRTVGFLEAYCDAIFGLAQSATEEALEKLREALLALRESLQKDIWERKTVVFLPHKASQWEYIASVWQSAVEDENCDVYVVPIPYYYKEYDGAFREMQYEAELFPEELHVIPYDAFDFGLHYPDMIFTQNPYDEYNPVISVHSFFYSSNLKQFTEKLVYIPPFVLEEFSQESYREWYNMQYYCTMPGVVNADCVIVQSENMKQLYVEKLTEFAGEDTKGIWEKKILGLGSPKSDVQSQECELPVEWKPYVLKDDGSRKKIILYYVSLSSFTQQVEMIIAKIKSVLDIFEENCKETVVIWKTSSLIKSTLEQVNPEVYKEYCDLEQLFLEKKIGILDEEMSNEQVVRICDAYYGDTSPMVQMCRNAGKPVMIQDVSIGVS